MAACCISKTGCPTPCWPNSSAAATSWRAKPWAPTADTRRSGGIPRPACTRVRRSAARMAARWDTESRLMQHGVRGCSQLACVALLGAVLCSAQAHAGAARVVASHTWTSVSTPHVDVLTDAGRDVGERVAGQLEDLRT